MAMRCFWPPLRLLPFSPTTVSYLHAGNAHGNKASTGPGANRRHMWEGLRSAAGSAACTTQKRSPGQPAGQPAHPHPPPPPTPPAHHTHPLGSLEMKPCALAAMAACTTSSMLAPLARAMLSKMEEAKRVGVWLTRPICGGNGQARAVRWAGGLADDGNRPELEA